MVVGEAVTAIILGSSLLTACAPEPQDVPSAPSMTTTSTTVPAPTKPPTLKDMGITVAPVKPVRAGAYCDRVGRMGVLKNGDPARCTEKPKGSKPRWRSWP